jgi:hypothetical protein
MANRIINYTAADGLANNRRAFVKIKMEIFGSATQNGKISC